MIIAGPAHAAVMAEIHQAAFATGSWDTRSFETLLRQPGVLGLVDEAGGVLLLRMVVDEAEILTIGAAAPRQGIGRRLLQAAIDAARGAGMAVMHLEVAAENTPALGLYAAFGFARNGLRKNYYADGGDALTLRLRLIRDPADQI